MQMTQSIDPFVLESTFAVLGPELGLRPVPLTPEIYENLDRDFGGFAGHVLISQYEFTADWPTWERHPAGDELVMLLAGRATLVLRSSAGDAEVAMSEPGACVIVPRDTWHTARIGERARMLFITPGEGTENREQPD